MAYIFVSIQLSKQIISNKETGVFYRGVFHISLTSFFFKFSSKKQEILSSISQAFQILLLGFGKNIYENFPDLLQIFSITKRMAEINGSPSLAESPFQEENQYQAVDFTNCQKKIQKQAHSTNESQKNQNRDNSLGTLNRQIEESESLTDRKRWSKDEDDQLLRLHQLMGNRWTQISASFPGRTHNGIKNHFYAEIRKAVRRANFFMRNQFSSKQKSINLSMVSKMITLLSEKMSLPPYFSQIMKEKGQVFSEFKYQIFQFSKKDENELLNETQSIQFFQLVGKMNYFLEEVRKFNLICKNKRNPVNLPRKTKNTQAFSKIEEKRVKLEEQVQENQNQQVQNPIKIQANDQQYKEEVFQNDSVLNYNCEQMGYYWPYMPINFVFFPQNINIDFEYMSQP